jgi:phage shock protein B
METFPFIISLVSILCGTLIIMVGILKGRRSKQDRIIEADDTQMLQELNHNMTRMEDRIESLETIIIERERQNRKSQ